MFDPKGAVSYISDGDAVEMSYQPSEKNFGGLKNGNLMGQNNVGMGGYQGMTGYGGRGMYSGMGGYSGMG